MQRAPATSQALCEAMARMVKPSGSSNSQIALVSSPEIVITGTQLAFGSAENDLKLSFGRLAKALAAKNAHFDHVVLSHLYITSNALSARVLALLPLGGTRSVFPIEALPSLDSSFGFDVVAVPDSAAGRP